MQAEIVKVLIEYLKNNIGVLFIGLMLFLAVVIIIAYKISKYFVNVNKVKSPDMIVCHRHEKDLSDHGVKLGEHSVSLKELCVAVANIQGGVTEINNAIAEMIDGEVGKRMWRKAGKNYKYLTDATLRQLVLYKVRAFIEFVELACVDISDSEMSARDKLVALTTSLELGAREVSMFFAKCGGDAFYVSFNTRHNNNMSKYSEMIENIILDPIDNHKERFIDASITFMNEFITTMIGTWMIFNSIDDIETDDDLHRIINFEVSKSEADKLHE